MAIVATIAIVIQVLSAIGVIVLVLLPVPYTPLTRPTNLRVGIRGGAGDCK